MSGPEDPATPADLMFEALAEGDTFEARYVIDAAVYEAFLRAFADRSPLHVDDDHARGRGFAGRVMHGAILNGFVSHFVGMRVPGRRALLHAVTMQYLRPSYLGDVLLLKAKVAQKTESLRVVVLELSFHNETQNVPAARGSAQVGIAA